MSTSPADFNAKLDVKVVPGASRTKVAGWLGSELKVTVSAPPESGKANAAVTELLAGLLKVPARSVTIAAGHTRAHKTVQVGGISQSDLSQRLTTAAFPPPVQQ